MTPIIIGNIQFAMALLVYSFMALWYVHPALKSNTWDKAIVPLLLVHAFRFGPPTILMPGQVDAALAMSVKETIALGDLLSSVLAIVAMVLIYYKTSGGKLLAWIFSVVGMLDIAVATVAGVPASALDLYMGFNLYILNFYVPMLIVTHVLIIRYLIKELTMENLTAQVVLRLLHNAKSKRHG